MSSKYIAIKVSGMNHYLWFETEKVTEENNVFVGKQGWGKGGAFTEIEVNVSEIVSRIQSDTPQYN